MKVCGTLIWYDESPTFLAAAVSGIARVCDFVVAVDGAYALYPGARPRSHPDQAETILLTCESMGVGCVIHRPQEVFWGNEVEKRNTALQLAKPFLTDGEDWIVVFDADYHVMNPTNPDLVRATLETTDKHVCTYTLLDGKDLLADTGSAIAATQTELSTDWTIRDRGVFRWADDLRYGPAHYFLRGTYDGTEQWLRGPDLVAGQTHRAADAEHLGRNLVLVHRRQHRPLVRQQANEGYLVQRDLAGVETINEETVAA